MALLIDLLNNFSELDSPGNIEVLIRDLGILLDKKADLPADIAGQIEKLDNGTYKISINPKDHYFRQRFTMAHELGHYLFHRSLIDDGITDSRLYRSTNRNITDLHEVQANKFASNLLLPLDKVMRDYQIFNDVNEVAKKWQVSPKAMKIRLGVED